MDKNIIFFDGFCGLCNGFVDFIMKIDTGKRFFFAPLQSELAETLLPLSYREDLKSVVVLIDGRIYRKSEAVQKIFKELGGVWKLGSRSFLPRFLLDRGYDVVASNRYRVFGKKDACRLPTADERERFLS